MSAYLERSAERFGLADRPGLGVLGPASDGVTLPVSRAPLARAPVGGVPRLSQTPTVIYLGRTRASCCLRQPYGVRPCGLYTFKTALTSSTPSPPTACGRSTPS